MKIKQGSCNKIQQLQIFRTNNMILNLIRFYFLGILERKRSQPYVILAINT